MNHAPRSGENGIVRGLYRRVDALSPARRGGLCLLLIAVVGALDHVTGYEIAFSIFYLVPVSIGLVGRARLRGGDLGCVRVDLVGG